MILEPRFGWAKLPGCPYWPAKIIKREQLECQVYVESDNAILRVKSKDFVPYCNRADFKTKKDDGIAALKRRKKYLCLEAFISDTAWMQNEINHENETETERPASQSSDTTLLPTEDTPTEGTTLLPTEDTPTEGTTLLPTEDTPIEDTTLLPTEDTPTEDTTLLPIEDMPIEDTTLLPTEDTPTEDTTLLPTEDMPIEDTTLLPTEDTPTEDPTLLPMEDMPIEDTTLLSTEDTPTEDKTLLPTEDTAMEDTNLLPTEGTPTEDTPTEDKTLLPTGDASMEDTTLLPTEDTPTEEKNLLPMEGTSPLPTFEPCENFVPDSCSEDDCTSSIFDFAGSSFVATKLQVVNSCSEDDEESPLFTARKLTSYGENDHFEDHEYYHSDDRQERDDLEDPDYVESEGDEVDEDVTLGEFVNEITENKCKELNRPTPSSSSHESVIEMNLARPLGRDIKEEDKLRDKEFKEIYVKKYKILYEGKKAMKKDSRPYDTVHSCKFCNGLFTHIQDHMDNKHGHKPQVKEIIEMKKKLKELQDNTLQKKIRSLQCLLRYEGDHIHNKKVVHYKEGELLVQRKACGKEIFAHHHYGPCPKCFLWLHIDRSLQAHQKNCIGHVNSGTVEFGRSKKAMNVAESHAIIGRRLENIDCKCPLVKKHVLPIMRNDEIGSLAKEDHLILELGEVWMVKSYGNKLARNKTSSFRMRLCARLLTSVRKLAGTPSLTTRDILCPQYFDYIVQVALELCGVDDSGMPKHPSVALKVGYDMGRLAGLKLCACIKEQDEEGAIAVKQFLKLIKMQWSTKVSKFAHLAVNEKHFDNHRELPHPNDIATVAECLVGLAKELNLSDVGHYAKAVQVALPRLMVYNRRRSGEIEALSITRYQRRTTSIDDVEQSLLGELTTLEKYLLESQELMWIRGKQGKRVPVLIPPDLKDALAYIALRPVRDAAGVKEDSPYLFANTGHGVYSALQSLRMCCNDKNLIHPDRLTSTGFRAYMATIAQCIGLKDHEVQWMCDHLGHTIDVHKSHYRHTMEGIERIQLGKLLMVQDRNLVKEYSLKGLEGIQFSDIVHSFDDEKKQGPEPVDTFTFEDCGDDHEEGEGGKKNKYPVRQKWTFEEEEELKSLFKENFRTLKCPNTNEITIAKERSEKNSGLIQLRKLENIKKKMSNILLKMKRN